MRRAIGSRYRRVLLRRLRLGEEGALFASFDASRACWELFVALRGKDEVLVGAELSEPRVGCPFGEMYCMSFIAGGGLDQGRGNNDERQQWRYRGEYRRTPEEWAVAYRRRTQDSP
jgi:hypothetical protein